MPDRSRMPAARAAPVAGPPTAPPPGAAWQYGLHLAHDPRAARIARATLTLVLREHDLEPLVETAELLPRNGTWTLFSRADGTRYASETHGRFGETVDLPEPFGFPLETGLLPLYGRDRRPDGMSGGLLPRMV
jgi:hypothetical protein